MTEDAIVMTIDSIRTRGTTQETLITFAVPVEHSGKVATFLNKIGYQVAAAFAEVEGGVVLKRKGKPKKPHGDAAQALKLSGFFRHPEVWRAIGTDEEFRAWIQRQPSAWSGEFDYHEKGRNCEAAHVSRIEYGRGAAHKPEFSCIPLTHAEHMLHHAKGESALGGREWFERMRIKYVEAWSWETLRERLGYQSMGEVPPELIVEWARSHDVLKYLPPEYAQD